MVNKRNIMIVGCLLLAGVSWYLFLFENEETKVKKRFDYISERIEKIPGENPIVAAANVNRLKEVISETLLINAPAYSISRKINIKDFSSYTLARRFHFKEISLKFYDFAIDFPDDITATVIVTARMAGQLKSGDYVEDIHELQCRLQKKEDVWRLNELEVVEVLKR